MKRIFFLLSVILLGAVASSAQAAETAIPEGVFLERQNESQQLAKDFLLGAKVHDANGKIVGDVEDLILDEFNRVQGVIMGVGGVLGLGEKRIGVRLPALQIQEKDGQQIVVLEEATKDVLKALKPFERARPPKSFFERAMDKAKELATKTSETTSDAYKRAKEKVGPAYEQAKEKATEAYNAAKEKVQETVGSGEKKPAQ
jgi:sporulation protein YlmC with PRC-barrel domain